MPHAADLSTAAFVLDASARALADARPADRAAIEELRSEAEAGLAKMAEMLMVTIEPTAPDGTVSLMNAIDLVLGVVDKALDELTAPLASAHLCIGANTFTRCAGDLWSLSQSAL